MKKHLTIITAALLALGGGTLAVNQIQNQEIVQAAQSETQNSTVVKHADSAVRKAISAKANRKSRRTINKYVRNATKAIKRIKSNENNDVKTALTHILNTVKHPGIARIKSAHNAIEAISNNSTRISMDRHYTKNMAKIVSRSTHKSYKSVMSAINPATKKRRTKKHVKKSRKSTSIKYTNNPAYPNNPLDRKLTAADREGVKNSNDGKILTTYGPILDDIDDGKYKLSDIPGKDNMDRLNHLADHLGLKLTRNGHHWTMAELNKLDKQQNKSKYAKAYSKYTKKYAFVKWASELTIEDPRNHGQSEIDPDPITGFDDIAKAVREVYVHTHTKAQIAKHDKEIEDKKYNMAIADPKTGDPIDVSKEYERLVKSGMSRNDAMVKIDQEHGIVNDSSDGPNIFDILLQK